MCVLEIKKPNYWKDEWITHDTPLVKFRTKPELLQTHPLYFTTKEKEKERGYDLHKNLTYI